MRAFIGFRIEADDSIKNILNELSGYSEVKIVDVDKLHMTLRFLGEVDEQDIEKIKKQLNKLEFKSFSFTLAGIGAFPDKNMIKVVHSPTNSEKLIELREQIENLLADAGFMRDPRFNGHLTFARVKRKPPEAIKRIFEREFKKEVHISNVELIKSTLTPKGPVYETLHEVKLS